MSLYTFSGSGQSDFALMISDIVNSNSFGPITPSGSIALIFPESLADFSGADPCEGKTSRHPQRTHHRDVKQLPPSCAGNPQEYYSVQPALFVPEILRVCWEYQYSPELFPQVGSYCRSHRTSPLMPYPVRQNEDMWSSLYRDNRSSENLLRSPEVDGKYTAQGNLSCNSHKTCQICKKWRIRTRIIYVEALNRKTRKYILLWIIYLASCNL